jgi:hypothetical protein
VAQRWFSSLQLGAGPGSSARSVEYHRQVAPAQLHRPLPLAELDRRHELEHQRQVVHLDVGAQDALDPVEEPTQQVVCTLGQSEHVLGRRERAGQGKRHRARVGVDQPVHVLGECGPIVALVGQRRLGLLDEHGEPIQAKLAQQFLLAAVARVERADPHAGLLRHRGDRGGRVGEEHLARRLKDLLVVARRLDAPAGQG